LRVFAGSALRRVPLYALAAGGVLFLVAQLLARALGDSVIATVGSWSLSAALTSFGLVFGGLVGLAGTAERVLDVAEDDLRDWLRRLPVGDGERLFPSIELEQFRRGYEDSIKSIYGTTLGRLPLPGFAHRKVQSQFRHALVDEFLTQCEARGSTTIGFNEVRQFLLLKGLPIVTRPAHAQFKIWTLLLCGVLGVCVSVPLLIGLLANRVDPRGVILGTFGFAGVMVLATGLPRASRCSSPWRWRLGILIIGLGLVLWPIAWTKLWGHDLGMVWIIIVAITVWTFHRGVRLAFMEC
jgi:hypothetical protein